MNRNSVLPTLGVSLLLFLIACSGPQGRFQHEFQSGCWDISDTLRIQIAEPGSVSLLVELGQDYAYRNLYLHLRHPQADGSIQEVQLLETVLDPIGNWLVEPAGGGYPCQFGDAIELSPDLTYPIELEVLQFMRDSNLCEVNRVVML